MPHTIHVFKTNVHSFEQIKRIDSVLSERSEIKKWNIDLEDCDKVLRIESSKTETIEIIQSLKPFYIYCEDLD